MGHDRPREIPVVSKHVKLREELVLRRQETGRVEIIRDTLRQADADIMQPQRMPMVIATDDGGERQRHDGGRSQHEKREQTKSASKRCRLPIPERLRQSADGCLSNRLLARALFGGSPCGAANVDRNIGIDVHQSGAGMLRAVRRSAHVQASPTESTLRNGQGGLAPILHDRLFQTPRAKNEPRLPRLIRSRLRRRADVGSLCRQYPDQSG